jgi:hypothetical protein
VFAVEPEERRDGNAEGDSKELDSKGIIKIGNEVVGEVGEERGKQ